MNLTSKLTMVQNVEYTLRDRNGRIKQLFQPNRLARLLGVNWKHPLLGSWQDSLKVSNLIVNAGKAGRASRVNGDGGEAAFTSIGIGTGTLAASATDTALQTGVKADGTSDSGVHALPTSSVTASRITSSVANDTAQLAGTVTFTASMSVTESGVFNANTNGTMLARQVFSAIPVVATDSLLITWRFQAS